MSLRFGTAVPKESPKVVLDVIGTIHQESEETFHIFILRWKELRFLNVVVVVVATGRDNLLFIGSGRMDTGSAVSWRWNTMSLSWVSTANMSPWERVLVVSKQQGAIGQCRGDKIVRE